MSNTLPKLLDTLRPTLRTVSEWTRVGVPTVATWQQGAYQPKPDKRKALLKAVRRHAERLLALADRVEHEAPATSPDGGNGRRKRAAGGRRDISPKVRRTGARRAKKRRVRR